MSRPLADMTEQESAECVGMWCETSSPRGLGILALTDYERQDCIVLAVDSRDSWLHDLAEVTPRLDLPRAWTPDGEPVPGEWQYHPAYTGVYQDGTTSLNLIGVETYSKQHAEWECADIHRDDPAVHFFPVRRYATDWEEA